MRRGLLAFSVFLLIFGATKLHAQPGEIVLYETADWTGTPFKIHEREIGELSYFGWDNPILSIEVTAGGWILYRDDDESFHHHQR